MVFKNLLLQAVEVLRNQSRLVVLTGAGISVDSGLPDFRGPTGLWSTFDPKEASIERFIKDPASYWKLVTPLAKKLERARPNAAHKALARLEKSKFYDYFTLITQNIDNLHQKAGSKNVIEIHGTYLTASCLSCGAKTSYESIKFQLKQGNPTPFCDRCMFGTLKSDVLLFGERPSMYLMDKVKRIASDTDAMLIIGTSLEVYPAAALPLKAKENGVTLIGINTVSNCHDQQADFDIDICLSGRAAIVIPRLVKALLANQPSR